MRDSLGREIHLDDLVEVVNNPGVTYKVLVMHPGRVTLESPSGYVAAMIHPNMLIVVSSR